MPLQPGLMMDRPLLISAVLEHGAAQHGRQQVVSRETHGPLHRSTYAEVARRARQLANALAHLGLKAGSAVGSTLTYMNAAMSMTDYLMSGILERFPALKLAV